jgi:hypothetical protein
MENLKMRILSAFQMSRKLKNVEPSEGQLQNILHRLQQIFTAEELESMDEKTLARQVERVWPVARYIDRK